MKTPLQSHDRQQPVQNAMERRREGEKGETEGVTERGGGRRRWRLQDRAKRAAEEEAHTCDSGRTSFTNSYFCLCTVVFQ